MDSSEQIAERYLRSIGFESIVFEPDGNKTPDFLVNGEIAVEVRRLNLNFTTSDGKISGHEEVFIPTLQRFNKYLSDFGTSKDGESWYVSFEISRPLEPWSEIRSSLDSSLKSFMSSSSRFTKTIQITPHFRINIFRAGQRYDTFFFVFGSGADDFIGGQVIEDVRSNLEICINEKTQKTAPFRAKYPTWWLVLPDFISFGMDFEDQRQFKELPPIAHDWQRVILVNPRNPSDAFDV